MISWPLFFSIVILAGGTPILAAFLRAKGVSLVKLYWVLVGVATPTTFVVFGMPASQVVNQQYTWFTLGGYAFPTPWILLLGLAIGNFAFLCLWALIKYGNR
jgi:hypothetical protein